MNETILKDKPSLKTDKDDNKKDFSSRAEWAILKEVRNLVTELQMLNTKVREMSASLEKIAEKMGIERPESQI
ncbi:MAG TPA: hypothetical protein VGB30_06540 [bacterium]|jgi:hypothetical protein